MMSEIKTGSQIASELSLEIQGKTILTTGVSPGGLGAQFIETISKHNPKLLILAGRTLSKLKETQAKLGPKVNTKLLILDLSSQAQIRKAAEQVLVDEQYEGISIDVIVNNAGIMATSAFSKTQDGIEMQFACNHIGHFLFTNLIMSKLVTDHGGGRIINVSSDGYRLGPVRFKDHNFQDGNEYNRWRAYGQSKTANMLFSIGLAKRLHQSKGILSLSLHPGVIKTQLSSELDMSAFQELVKLDKMDGHIPDPEGFTYLNLDQGTANHVYAAFHPELQRDNNNGAYLEECRVLPPQEVLSWARDDVEADTLWMLSEKLVGQSFSY